MENENRNDLEFDKFKRISAWKSIVRTQLLWWNWVENDITNDAWGRPKTVIDRTLFHSLFTFNIPNNWLIYENGVEIKNNLSTKITSISWHWNITSWAIIWNTWFLRSKRHPRYQPNRWHLFSTACFLPTPNAIWIRKIWMMNTIIQVCFMLEDGVLYAYIENNSTQKIKTAIDISAIWLTINDLQYWHLYDIQYQWRWVWDYFFYIDQKLVFQTNFLWTNTELTIFNPALGAWFYCENTDWINVQIQVWCIDITSEWWIVDETEYRSVSNLTTKAVSTADYPVIIIHIKETFNWLLNTRDIQAFRVTWSLDQKWFMKSYITRDLTAITWASFLDLMYDSCIEYDISASAININKCQLLWNKRVELDSSTFVDIPSNNTNFYLTSWDYLIITMQRENPILIANAVVFFEWGEEI